MSKRIRNTEEQKLRTQLRSVFKRVVRMLVMNKLWYDGDQKISTNAKRNISLLVRQKRKIGMLTAAEKTLLITPHRIRTIADRKKLCNLFLELRCFYWIPPKMRAHLIPVIKYITISAGRTVIRTGDMPVAVYFIITGEVQRAYTKYIKLTGKTDTKVEMIYGPGDCIGDVEILEDCLRTHSLIAASQCELLVLFESDFNSILKPYMQKIWNEKKKAIKALDYFKFLNEEQITSACKLGTIKQFNALDTIYNEDKGTLTNVHFVLSGECCILQCLNMKVTVNNGKKIYELIDIERDNGSETSIPEISSINSAESQTKKKNIQPRKFHIREMEKACGLGAKTQLPSITTSSKRTLSASIHYYEEEYKYYLDEYLEEGKPYSSRSHSKTSVKDISSFRSSISFAKQLSKIPSSLSISSSSSISIDSDAMLESERELSLSDSEDEAIESRFIDVGSLTFGGIFGLGEQIKDRVIMARSTVQCLMLPRFFLLEKEQNPENVWHRRLFYMECIIPSRETLFDDFLKTLNWKKFKHDFISQSLKSDTNDIGREEDIPIICRIIENM
ncbi:uncharacterized protein LOC108601996 isoform X1 [Drosophila busckii]|uniref:uncharacterized protein LOC108601996 isoform X1 n=2 Tax=Drosophila busckii TaxID=30019 RepID=UPI00083EDE33|nr:uncharacterized protein LOC108601996 isoform X1 [Drosophila busckii]